MEQLKESGSRFIIKMPTGSGKTRVAMEVISDYINSSDEKVNIISALLIRKNYVNKLMNVLLMYGLT